MNSTQLGRWGEDKAADFLQKQGCQLLSRNYRSQFGEIDLIMEQGQILLFVEVKLRKNRSFGGAAAAVTPSKQQKLILTAQAWLASEKRESQVARFDVVEVYAPHGAAEDYQVNWIPNAFEVT